MAAILKPHNESEASFSRITKDGRRLTYELRVLQQPQRARACGSGAKSSADRRPVDPPPVIELKVFEGEQKTDITFNHKANFFVYTTLETARPIAQPRNQPISQPPVLTGSPVSGAALLDRPSPAAYFIFPDLSVRHEGKYRLSFNLFEELKDVKDEDANSPLNNPSHPSHALMGSSPMAAQAHVHFRLEVKSKPFTVYSAKKFPGLSESTNLSRVVAEQGCRVRIRRDVRMRRRDNKSGKDGSDHEEVSYQSYSEPSSADLYRQPSMEQLQQSQQPQAQPTIEHNYYSQPQYNTTQYAQPQQVPSYVPQSRPSSQQTYHPVQSSSVEQSPIQTNAYAHSYTQYQPHQPHTRHASVSSTHENIHAPQPSTMMPHQQSQHPMSHYSTANGYQVGQQDPAGIGAKTVFWSEQQNAARTLAIDNEYSVTQQPRIATATELRAATPNSAHLPPLKSLQPAAIKTESHPQMSAMVDNSGMAGMPSMSGSSIAAQVRSSGKRGYDRVFDAGRSTGMVNGGRQDTAGQDYTQIATEEGLIDMHELLNMKMLSYRRANGAIETRRITSPNEA